MPPSPSVAPPWQPPDYNEDIDFDSLAIQDADFASIYRAADDKINFYDPKAVQQLTKTLLKRDFGLQVELPDNRLCPPVPVRYNYVHWIQSLLDTTSPDTVDGYDPDRPVTGLDIGVGASCIYPLLATSRPEWSMYGTDIDPASLAHAQNNIDINGLSSRIKIRLSTPDSPLLPLKALGVDRLDFCMCNPPFYSSKEDMRASENAKDRAPSAVCTGAEVEMICEGGDVGFVLRMVEESVELGEKVQWYTSMLGKLSSAYKVVDRLKELKVENWAVVCLRAGSKTRRWAIGWSFNDWRPRYDVARSGELPSALHPHPTAQTIFTPSLDRASAARLINTTLSNLDLSWKWDETTCVGYGSAVENVWSRAYRRKKGREADTSAGEDRGSKKKDVQMKDGTEKVALAFRIEVVDQEMEMRWVRGSDYIIFESFCGMLKRSMIQKG